MAAVHEPVGEKLTLLWHNHFGGFDIRADERAAGAGQCLPGH